MTAQTMTTWPAILTERLQVSPADIADFCQRWHIQELGLFGSVIRSDFRWDSDVDVLVVFDPEHQQHPFDSIHAQAELGKLFHRAVDLTQKCLLVNPFSKAEILRTYRIIYPPQSANFSGLIDVSVDVSIDASFDVNTDVNVDANRVMTDNARNHAALLDMVKAMQAIARFLVGRSFDDLLHDELFQGAVERRLEILGEAANRLTQEFQDAHPDIDWRGVIGLRNIIIHQYDGLDYPKIWEMITQQLPYLLSQVQPLVPPLPDA